MSKVAYNNDSAVCRQSLSETGNGQRTILVAGSDGQRTILVTGSDGQLGRSLYELVRHGGAGAFLSGTAFKTYGSKVADGNPTLGGKTDGCHAADRNQSDGCPVADGNPTLGGKTDGCQAADRNQSDGCQAAGGNALNVCGVRWVFTARKPSGDIETDDLLDITSEENIRCAIGRWKPVIIINCAAYTDVESAETRIEDASAVNVGAVSLLADAALSCGAHLIHFSTDYVFDGDKKSGPYTENDQPHPINAYGMSKYRGELFARKSGADVTVIRTSALFSEYGKNFVRTMCRLISEKESVSVVNDQTVSPTYAGDLAVFVLYLADSLLSAAARQRTSFVHASEPVSASAPVDSPEGTDSFRILNFSNEGSCTWFGFAEEIARLTGNRRCKVLPCTSEEYPSRVRRPRYSVLDKSAAKAFLNKSVAKDFLDKSAAKAFIDVIPSWRDALARCLANLGMAVES